MSAVISRPSAAELERVMDALEAKLEAEQPMTFGQVRACVPELDVIVNVALDRLQTAGRVTRCIIAGRVVYHLPDWTPPKPAHRKPEALANVEAPAPPAATVQMTVPQQFLLMELAAQQRPMSSPELALSLGMDREDATCSLKLLRDKGLVNLQGQKRGARWSLSDAGRHLAPAPPQNAATESHPGFAPPAAQPIDAGLSTAAPAARETYTAVTEPAGPRDGLSSSADPAANATLDWHAAAAEAEAQRRNAAPIADFPLPEAMSNTGEFEPETFTEPGATSLRIDEAKFAIWSDGRLEIDAGDLHLSLTKAATHRLFNFLDQFSSIEAH